MVFNALLLKHSFAIHNHILENVVGRRLVQHYFDLPLFVVVQIVPNCHLLYRSFLLYLHNFFLKFEGFLSLVKNLKQLVVSLLNYFHFVVHFLYKSKSIFKCY